MRPGDSGLDAGDLDGGALGHLQQVQSFRLDMKLNEYEKLKAHPLPWTLFSNPKRVVSSCPRVRSSVTPVIWLNDIETDPRYASWDPSLVSAFKTANRMQQLIYVRRNLYQSVAPVCCL